MAHAEKHAIGLKFVILANAGIQEKQLLRKQFNLPFIEKYNTFLRNEVIILDPRVREDDARAVGIGSELPIF